MIPFIYCHTNPEQKLIGEKICETYPFIPKPIYDTACMSEKDGNIYLEQVADEVKEKKVAIYISMAYPNIINYFEDRELFIFGETQLVSHTDHKKFVQHKEQAVKLNRECYDSASLVPYFISKPTPKEHEWRHDSRMEVRILLGGHGFAHTPYLSILQGLNSTGLNFRLIINNPSDYTMHENQWTNDTIKETLPDDSRISFLKDFSIKSADVAIIPIFKQSVNMHQALEANIPSICHSTTASVDLRTRYGCLLDINLNNPYAVGEAFRQIKEDSSVFEKLTTGMNSYNEMRKPEQVDAIYEPIFGTKKRMRRASSDGDNINVFVTCRNNETTIGKMLAGLKAMERRLGQYKFNYYFYENDSSDDTPNLIKDFFSYSRGRFLCEKLGKKHWSGSSDPRRMLDLAIYRNRMIELCDTWDNSTYSFILDSEIGFPHDIMEKQIAFIQSKKDAVMVTPYGKPEHSETYYDQYAYRGIKDDIVPIDINAPFEAKSAFCGFACILSSALRQSHWDCTGSESEHIHFCNMVSRYGKIYVDPNVEVRWKK